MKRLTLLRHAKSSWDDNTQRDFDRPLNERGRNAAPIVGACLAKLRPPVDLVLCSSAARTRETYELIAPQLRETPQVAYRDNLYLADPDVMLAAVHSASDALNHIVVIGHNPGMEMLAMGLCEPDSSDITAMTRLAEKYPTAGLASYHGPSSWRKFAKGACTMDRFVTPKELATRR